MYKYHSVADVSTIIRRDGGGDGGATLGLCDLRLWTADCMLHGTVRCGDGTGVLQKNEVGEHLGRSATKQKGVCSDLACLSDAKDV